MLYNTIPFVNTDNEMFVGRWEGEEYRIQVGETRFFPSELSRRLAKHLIEKLITKSKKSPEFNREKFIVAMEKQILGEEMMTKSEEKPRTFKDIALEHEAQVKAMMAEQERIKKAQKIEALKIAEDDV